MPETVRYIVIDGPRASGKSTIAKELTRALPRAIQDSFRAPLKHFMATGLGEKIDRIPKNSPVAPLGGVSISWLTSRLYDAMRDHCGDDVFGRLLVNRALRMHPLPRFVVCDDVGACEVDALPNVFVVRVAGKGNHDFLIGHDFTLHNDGDMAQLWSEVHRLADVLKEKANAE